MLPGVGEATAERQMQLLEMLAVSATLKTPLCSGCPKTESKVQGVSSQPMRTPVPPGEDESGVCNAGSDAPAVLVSNMPKSVPELLLPASVQPEPAVPTVGLNAMTTRVLPLVGVDGNVIVAAPVLSTTF